MEEFRAASQKLGDGVGVKSLMQSTGLGMIADQEGVGALWTGIGPNIARNAIINAAELASYDHVKQINNQHNVDEWLSLLHSSKNYCGMQKKSRGLSRTSHQEKEKTLMDLRRIEQL
ncbi:hypothetical protein HN51_071769 [Arachis hypogaea]|uniref:Uncharacterized protein n=2 Tax=Arachis hypogaea TaxID=3818 RepID=A0A444YX59_ARAHY|nr:Mitochondrial uncoupling protein [Arachis hypogaea]RYR06525.1 hypothetical protein Ahy_B05g073849 isoform E [Arachis hypogaea]